MHGALTTIFVGMTMSAMPQSFHSYLTPPLWGDIITLLTSKYSLTKWFATGAISLIRPIPTKDQVVRLPCNGLCISWIL